MFGVVSARRLTVDQDQAIGLSARSAHRLADLTEQARSGAAAAGVCANFYNSAKAWLVLGAILNAFLLCTLPPPLVPHSVKCSYLNRYVLPLLSLAWPLIKRANGAIDRPRTQIRNDQRRDQLCVRLKSEAFKLVLAELR